MDWDTFIRPLTYVYNTQVYRSTKPTPFSFVLSRHPPGPVLLKSGSALPTNSYAKTSSQVLRSTLEARICALRAKVNASMATAQKRHKQDYDRQVKVTTPFQPSGWVFIDRPPLAATSDTNATQTALKAYHKMTLQTLGPLRVKAVCSHSLAIDEH